MDVQRIMLYLMTKIMTLDAGKICIMSLSRKNDYNWPFLSILDLLVSTHEVCERLSEVHKLDGEKSC